MKTNCFDVQSIVIPASKDCKLSYIKTDDEE